MIILGIIVFILPLSNLLIQQKSELFKIPKNKTTLFLGHSHTACSINDSILERSINLASGGESYIYTYSKLDQLIKDNPQINQVVLGISNNQISTRMEKWTWELPNCAWSFPKYFFNSSFKENLLFFKENPKVYLNNLRLAGKENIKLLLKNDNLILSGKWGGYKELTNRYSEKKDSESTISKDVNEVSMITLEYIKKCVRLCEENSIEILFYRAPLLKNHSYLKNEPIFKDIMEKEFSEFEFIDLSKHPLLDENFSDAGHLNKYGAEKISTYLNSLANFSN